MHASLISWLVLESECGDFPALFQQNTEDDINEHFTGVPTSHDYAPYGNKTVRSLSQNRSKVIRGPQMCYLDILDNLPRLRLSSSQFKMILWMMKECGAKDVPSFNAFRAMQTHIRKTTGVRSEPNKSDLGNLFYVNDIRDLIAKVRVISISLSNAHNLIPLD